MADDFHDVVKLLLKRMKSHPEEFGHGVSRWGWMLENVLENCSDEERAALKKGLRPILMQEIHEHVMDELLNGDERRRREMEEAEYEKQLLQQAKTAKAVLLSQQTEYNQRIMQEMAQPRVPTRHPTSSDMEKNGIMNTLRSILK